MRITSCHRKCQGCTGDRAMDQKACLYMLVLSCRKSLFSESRSLKALEEGKATSHYQERAEVTTLR